MVPPSTSMSTLACGATLERLIDGHADDGHDQAIAEIVDAPLRADRRHPSEDDLLRAARAFNEWNRRAFLRHRRRRTRQPERRGDREPDDPDAWKSRESCERQDQKEHSRTTPRLSVKALLLSKPLRGKHLRS